MKPILAPLSLRADLLPGEFLVHRQRNYDYMMELTTDNLLLHFRREAGLTSRLDQLDGCHFGWDGPLSDLRGQVTGHWLSAAARLIHTTGDARLKAKADYIVAEMARCQREHGDGWAFPIPEKNLYWLKRGKHSWAPQYVCHKCMLGLLEMYTFTQNQQALDVLLGEADWFDRFTADITPEQMDDMMDWEETGAMMELWADLYAITGNEAHLRMMRLYERRRIFDPLLRGEDVLTNMHANTTIPEVHGAARAYEVTGEERYRDIVERYWDMAVTKRGMYATGSQTCGELWTPMGKQSARLGDKNQEHCVVYNMIRLADYLLRWTGDARYADYIEQNLWNGLLSQAHWREDKNNEIDCDCPKHEWAAGLVAYYQPLAAGSVKRWATKTNNFWCCVDTMLQANTLFHEYSFYKDAQGLVVQQYHGCKTDFDFGGASVHAEVDTLPRTDSNIHYDPVQRDVPARPTDVLACVKLHVDKPVRMKLRVRLPWWLKGEARATLDGCPAEAGVENGYLVLEREWTDNEVRISLPKGLTVYPLPDEPDTVAFLDGPIVLAGLCGEERTLYGQMDDPATLLKPDMERQWQVWLGNWRTHDQPVNIAFRPLYTIGNQQYTVYFPVRGR